ncbi:hypothetical protein [Escherichia coli]|uniref:hypothetical protein n=1 Tax=Escherichia coli TaxID=562 RepID=UPI003EE38F29
MYQPMTLPDLLFAAADRAGYVNGSGISTACTSSTSTANNSRSSASTGCNPKSLYN